jgi:hypothetical protein
LLAIYVAGEVRSDLLLQALNLLLQMLYLLLKLLPQLLCSSGSC